jgi:hypothetical protein
LNLKDFFTEVEAMSKPSSKRAAREQERKRKQTRQWLIGGGIAALLLAAGLIGLLGRDRVSAMGDEVPVASADHVTEGTDPGPYETDPPAGGKHYPTDYPSGLYEDGDPETQGVHPEGYLVHSLEHGYIIYWYNCAADAQVSCDELKTAIRQVMDENDNYKVIGFPWASQAEPLVMTSWGRILRLDGPDLEAMRNFYTANLEQSPEPHAD